MSLCCVPRQLVTSKGWVNVQCFMGNDHDFEIFFTYVGYKLQLNLLENHNVSRCLLQTLEHINVAKNLQWA